jgi:hypothetical protein
MKLPYILAISVVALALVGACRPQSRQPQTYDPVHRCGGIEKPWFSASNAPAIGDLMPIGNEIRITGAGITWNGSRITPQILPGYATAMSQMNPSPRIELGVNNGLSCTAVQQVRTTLAAYCSKAVCIEYSEREWAKIHAPPPPCDADCQAYGRAGGSYKGLSDAQKARLKRNYIDKYGFIPW